MTGTESALATGHGSATVNEHYRAALIGRSGGALMALDTEDGPCYTRKMATLESRAFLQNRQLPGVCGSSGGGRQVTGLSGCLGRPWGI